MTLSQTNSASASAIGQEQSYLDMLYRLLDEARDRTERALTQTQGSGGAGGTFQARVERDITAADRGRTTGRRVSPSVAGSRSDLVSAWPSRSDSAPRWPSAAVAG